MALFIRIVGFAFALGLLLFGIGWLGGGDVKLIVASALWFDLSGLFSLLIYITLSGGILGLILIFARRLVPQRSRERLGWPALQIRGPIPYGIAVSVGVILAVLLHGPNPTGLRELQDIKLEAFPEAPR